jgi:hypothetical protein
MSALSETVPLRTVYSTDHSPIVHYGTTYEWDEFLDKDFPELVPQGEKPIATRAVNALQGKNIYSIRGLLTRYEADLLDIQHFGSSALDHICSLLRAAGLRLLTMQVDPTDFFEVHVGWRVHPAVLAKLQTRELGFFPQAVADDYPTVGQAIAAWQVVKLSSYRSVATTAYYEELVSALLPYDQQ